MSLCFVFSGTSEGRELTERLADSGINCLVFVATEYGNAVMKSHPNVEVNVGRLDSDNIAELIKKKSPDFIIDATHPHAEIITENIKAACDKANVKSKYLRVNRNVNDEPLDNNDSIDNYDDVVYSVSSVDEAIALLINKSENGEDVNFSYGKIMLTTGVKELKHFVNAGLTDRLIARIIPSIESLEEAYKCGLSTKSIIAMEGPFSVEMNISFIKQYNASLLVTKNSGSRGGYKEKVLACKKCGIKAIVIENKESGHDGMSVKEAVSFIKTRLKTEEKKHIYLVGAGMCREDLLTLQAASIIRSAEVIIGAKRMMSFGSSLNENAKVFDAYEPEKVLSIIDSLVEKKIVVLFSGDTGLCSGAKGLEAAIRDRKDIDYQVIPGISSVSYFSSKAGIQYSDYPFVSLHNKESDYINIVDQQGGFIAICSGVKDVVRVSKDIIKFNENKRIICGYNLCKADEKIFEIVSSSNLDSLNEGLYVIAVIDR